MGVCVPDDLEAGIQKSGYQHGLFLVSALSLVGTWPPFPYVLAWSFLGVCDTQETKERDFFLASPLL